MRWGTQALFAMIAWSIVGSNLAHAQDDVGRDTVWVSPGIKVGYTRDGGFTLGFEISIAAVPDIRGTEIGDLLRRGVLVGYGFVFSFDHAFRENINKTHVGVEWIGPALGLQFGPTLVRDREGRHLGFGLTPWIGSYAIPYMTWTGIVGRDNLLEFGILLKYHACVSREDACGDGDELEIDD